MSILGNRLKHLREKSNYSQKRVADTIGISNVQLSRYESGDRNPDPELIAKFADYYDVTTDYLHGRTDNPKSSQSKLSNTSEKDHDKEFQDFINDPELKRWYKDLPKSSEEDLQKLRKMWEIMKGEGK
ncbi:MAG: family transcriptional regulator [Bacillales bacterium]|jgi:transcriptional regulator with XRE-family HTH domain|nr:family transcriptional regulator [Bacillales bacterium]